MIFQEEEYADEIFFLMEGRAVYVIGDIRFAYAAITSNQYFGEIEVLKQTPRKYSVMAGADSSLLTLSRNLVYAIMEDFP